MWSREWEIDRWISEASAIMWTLSQSVVVKTELGTEVKMPVYWLMYIPTLT